MKLSVIIPTYNEADYIRSVINHLRDNLSNDAEVIVVDGGSTDETLKIVEELGIQFVSSPIKMRAAQMNLGASHASGDILYFLHADSYPPVSFEMDIKTSSAQYQAGFFWIKFDWDHWLLQFSGWLAKFNINAFRFGDQSMYIAKELFEKIAGFDDQYQVCEDNEIVYRIRKHTKITVIQKRIISSARKYRKIGAWRLQWVYLQIYSLYRLGLSQQKLFNIYRKKVR